MTAPSFGNTAPLVPPLYQSSVYVLPDLDAIDAVYGGQSPGFIYARDAHPNALTLADQLAKLEGARWAMLGGSGMSVITATVLASVQQGDRLLVSNRLYGRTTAFLTTEMGRLGVAANVVDANDLTQVREALVRRPKLFVVETISNPLLRVPDVPQLVMLCHEHGCQVLVDNTFATPALYRPLKDGADFVMESLTKIITGHSDVTLGVVGGMGEQNQRLSQIVSIWGLMSSPFDCWLAARGLETFELRINAACHNAAVLADWLGDQPGVKRVVYPGRADHPDHGIARRLLGGRYGHVLCFELAGGRDAVNRFMRLAKGIPFSPSLGHSGTTCSHPGTTSHRFAQPEERARQGITDGLIRLSVGIEPVEELKQNLRAGLA